MAPKRSNIDLTLLGVLGENLGNGNEIFKEIYNGTTIRLRTLIASGGTKIITNGDKIVISGATVGAGTGDITNGSNRGSGIGIFDQKSGTTLTFKSISSLTPTLLKITNTSNTIFLSGGTSNANPAGLNKQIQYNKNNTFGADGNFTYDYTGNTLTIASGLTPSIGKNNLINKSVIIGCNNIGFGNSIVCGNNNISNITSTSTINGNCNLIIGSPNTYLNSCGNVINGNGIFCNSSNGIMIGCGNSLTCQQYYNVIGTNNLLTTNSALPTYNRILGYGNTISSSLGCHTIIGNTNYIGQSTNDIKIFGNGNSVCCGTSMLLLNSIGNSITGYSGCFNYATFIGITNYNTSLCLPVSNYSTYALISNLGIICTPLSGSTSNDLLLTWNPTDKKVKRITFSSLVFNVTPAGGNAEIQINNLGAFGTSNKFKYGISCDTLEIGNVSNTCTCCSIIVGGSSLNSICCSNLNLTIGTGNKIEKNNYGLVVGTSNTICNTSTTTSSTEFILGASNILCHSAVADLNHTFRSVFNGYNNMIGCSSYASIINSCNSCICYSSNRTIINSTNTSLFDNTPGAQGTNITLASLNNFCLNSLSSYNYGCHLITGNLAIACTPLSGSTSDDVMVWNNTDKKVKRVAQSSIGGTNLVQKVSVTLTPTQIMNNTYVQILSSPGINKIIIPLNVISMLNWVNGNIIYNAANEYLLSFSNNGIDEIAEAGGPDADFLTRNYKSITNVDFNYLGVALSGNLPLYVGNLTNMSPPSGNSTLTITITYIILDI